MRSSMGLRQREEMTRVCTTLQSAENGGPLQAARYCIKRPRQVSQQNIGIDRFEVAARMHAALKESSDPYLYYEVELSRV